MVKFFIYFTFGEAKLGEIIVDHGVLSTRRLLQSIQRSLESAHVLLSVEGLKSFNLLNVHLFLNQSIEESCLHIHLMYLPSHLRLKL